MNTLVFALRIADRRPQSRNLSKVRWKNESALGAEVHNRRPARQNPSWPATRERRSDVRKVDTLDIQADRPARRGDLIDTRQALQQKLPVIAFLFARTEIRELIFDVHSHKDRQDQNACYQAQTKSHRRTLDNRAIDET